MKKTRKLFTAIFCSWALVILISSCEKKSESDCGCAANSFKYIAQNFLGELTTDLNHETSIRTWYINIYNGIDSHGNVLTNPFTSSDDKRVFYGVVCDSTLIPQPIRDNAIAQKSVSVIYSAKYKIMCASDNQITQPITAYNLSIDSVKLNNTQK
ncbi:hypothetical protein [Pedobacter arcticus]|uniref:hypothetical protein n=1 Tax=Pedobacter arcticus TaxID=752140 RepID=UPI0003727E50|nr:hypothetical protein [Pedobacter arcticus]